VQELLAGAVPGLSVSKGSGAVGSGAEINIRGTSTIGGSSGVLVLIDGIPGNMYTLNPNDIESISVLKDAASASIYGSRAANGVVLITTKMAKESSRPIVEISSHIGVQNPQLMLDFVGASDYMRLYDEAMRNDGKDAYFGEQGQQDLKAGKYPDNKWYKEIFKKNTLINNTHIALSGRENSIIYRLSISNDYQDGTLPNNKYNRFIIKPDLQFQLLKNLKARLNMQYTQTNIQNPNNGTTHWQSQASRISPITPIKEENGLYGIGDREGNPIAGVHEAGYAKERHKEMLAIFDVVYTPLKDWNIKGTVASYTHNNTSGNRSKTYHLYDADGNIARTENLIPTLREANSYAYRTQIQFITDYKFSIKEQHNFSFLAGYSQEYYKTDNFWASRDNMPFDDIDVLDTGSGNIQNGGNAQDVAIQSVFGRVNYDYMGKYLFEASLRSDGSSRFAAGHRWGIFPSLSGGWNLHREAFMEKFNWLSELKIRASWGTLGDAEKVGYYPTAQVLTYNPKIYAFNNALVGGAYNATSVNKNITWEISEQTNIGLDIGFLDQRIKFTAEYFINRRKDILYTPPVPTEFGLSAPISNLLEMKNTGMEFLLAYNDRKGDFNWGFDMNVGFSKNKVLKMGDSDKWIEGNVITYLNDRYQLPYGYEAEGLFQSEEDIKAHAPQGNVLPGNIKFKDQNGDHKIDGEDRIVLSRKIPINYGANLYLGYKGMDLSVNMYGKLNTERYISGYEGWAFYLTQNARPIHLDAWSETNKNASYPRLTLTNTSNDTQYNSFWLRKADYLKIQNIQFGYVLPRNILDKIHIDYLRFYLSCQNMATITGYDGFDPEGSWYPLSRTFAFGFNLKF
jgi:TonB-linked SusC/RagA family outer membrane protein